MSREKNWYLRWKRITQNIRTFDGRYNSSSTAFGCARKLHFNVKSPTWCLARYLLWTCRHSSSKLSDATATNQIIEFSKLNIFRTVTLYACDTLSVCLSVYLSVCLSISISNYHYDYYYYYYYTRMYQHSLGNGLKISIHFRCSNIHEKLGEPLQKRTTT